MVFFNRMDGPPGVMLPFSGEHGNPIFRNFLVQGYFFPGGLEAFGLLHYHPFMLEQTKDTKNLPGKPQGAGLNDGDRMIARELLRQNCQNCHADKPLETLKLQIDADRNGRTGDVADLESAIRDGVYRKGSMRQMSSFKSVLDAGQIALLAKYIRELRSKNATATPKSK